MSEIIYNKDKDSYQILGLSPLATDEEIKSRYRKLSRLFHPDLHNSDPASQKKQQDINEAYNNLNSQNRTTYDKLRNEVLKPNKLIKKFGETLNDLSKTASNFAFRFINSSGIENLEAYDEYIKFLHEIEPKFIEYGESIIPFLEGVANKRGKISKETLEQYQITIKRELEFVKRRASAFDEFQIFYKKSIEEMQKLYNKTIPLKDYTNPSNRTKYNQSDYEKKKTEIKNILKKLSEERLMALNNLKVELGKRYIRYNDFLKFRGLEEQTISSLSISKLNNLLPLIDQLKIILNKQGIAIEDYLNNMGLNIMTVTEEQLELILNNLSTMQSPNLVELDKILRENSGEDKTMRTPWVFFLYQKI